MTTNHLPIRKLEITGRGGARYLLESHAPAEWLVQSIPGAAEAREAWRAENAKGEELYRAYMAAQKAAPATQWTGDPGEAVPGPARGVSYADWDKGRAAVADAEAALNAQAKKALAALRRFDSLAYSGVGTPAEYKAAAAEHALAKHAEALAAYEALLGALKERDEAHTAAGSPGRDWRRSAVVNFRSVGNIQNVLRPALDGFDVRAAQAAAEGERVLSHAEQIVAAREAADKASAKAASAAKRRTVEEGY